MDQGITLLLTVLAALATGAVVWAVMRRRLPAETIADIAQAAAQVRAVLGSAVTEDDVRSLAGYIYDEFAAHSRYITRDQFIDLVTRAVVRANASQSTLYAAARADGFIRPPA